MVSRAQVYGRRIVRNLSAERATFESDLTVGRGYRLLYLVDRYPPLVRVAPRRINSRLDCCCNTLIFRELVYIPK